jgi:hypothetical protein
MAHVRKDHCPKLERRCLKDEYDKANHITICHRFEEGSARCEEPRFALDFCIDHYEFPNQKGARPPVMVDWYHAMGQCAAAGKRLCYESEWVAACEGPDDKPVPVRLCALGREMQYRQRLDRSQPEKDLLERSGDQRPRARAPGSQRAERIQSPAASATTESSISPATSTSGCSPTMTGPRKKRSLPR